MKKLLLLFNIILISTTLKSQVGTDLQFSQIITLESVEEKLSGDTKLDSLTMKQKKAQVMLYLVQNP